MDDEIVAGIERATLAAVPPQALETLQGWLLALDHGTVGRARSAVPLSHGGVPAAQAPALIAAVQARYAAFGTTAQLRVPCLPAFDALRAALRAQGWRAAKPTLTLTGRVETLVTVARGLAGRPPRRTTANAQALHCGATEALLRRPADAACTVDVSRSPGEDWAAVFLGEGFDPVDAASRLAILRRARDSVFVGLRVQGRMVAVGSACFAQGWCGVHGMRTAAAWRGAGLAARVLAMLGRQARLQGIERSFLQVEQGNASAIGLYRRAGFEPAWSYEYWNR